MRAERGSARPAGLGRLIRRVPALKAHIVVSFIAACATAAVVLVQAEVLSSGLARLAKADAHEAGRLVWGLAFVGLVRACARFATELSATRALARTRERWVELTVDQLDALDADARGRVRPAFVAALLASGPDALEPWVRGYVPAVALAAVVPLVAGLRILSVDRLSAAILLVAIPLIPVFMVLIGRLAEERSRRDWAVLGRLAHHFADVLDGLETLRLFGRAEQQVSRVREITEEYRRSVMATLRVAFLSAFVLELLATMSVALVAVSVGVRLSDGALSLPAALTVLLLAPECSLPLRRVGAAFHAAQAGTDAAQDLEALLAESVVPAGRDEPGKANDGVIVAGVVVAGVGRPRRVGPVDLVARAGEFVVVDGPSGAGKSTLLAAMAGELGVSEGSICLAGHRVESGSPAQRRAVVAHISQFPVLTGASVGAAVALGAAGSPASAETVAMASATALAELGMLWATDRSPAELSGGERQRVAVARALVRARVGGARVVLADEPTSHLDAETTRAVVEALRGLARQGKVVVVASHDPAVASGADKVVSVAASIEPGAGSVARDLGRFESAERPAEPEQPEQPEFPGRPEQPGLPGRPERPAAAGRASLTGGRMADVVGVRAAADPGAVGDWRWLRRHMAVRGIGWARALGIAAEACGIGLVAAASWLIMRAAQRPLFSELAVVAVAVRAFGLGRGVFRYAERLSSHDTALRQLASLRALVVERVARLVPAGLPHSPRGELISAATHDVDRVGDAEVKVVGPLAAMTVVALGAAIIVGAIAAAVGLVYLGAFGLAAALSVWVYVGVRGSAPDLVAAKAEVAATAFALGEQAEELARLRAIDHAAAPVRLAARRLSGVERQRGAVIAFATALLAGLGSWTAAAAVAVVASRVGTLGGPAIGVLVLSALALGELLVPSVAVAEAASTVTSSAARLRRLIERPDPHPDPVAPVTVAPAGRLGAVRLERLGLAWPHSPTVLRDVTLLLSPGTRTLVWGPSGSGKSTLAAGLVAFLAPTCGRYELDRIDTRVIGPSAVRREVTWCAQEPWLADTSVRENLRLAAPGADDSELAAALRAVHLDGWVSAQPRGLDTMVGRHGTAMSGGERQRLALARVLLAGHHVVVLDEPTAHLDAGTAEAALLDLLGALGAKTVLLLAHQPGNVGALRDVELTQWCAARNAGG